MSSTNNVVEKSDRVPAQQNDGWTIQRLIQWTTDFFKNKKIESARLDAEILLSHVLGCKRLDLYLRFDLPVSEAELATFKSLVKRRQNLEPVAYILGYQEFYGKKFSVGPGVLIPRPETELIVDEALKWLKEKAVSNPNILDVGSGSGCLGVTMASENLNSTVVACDISDDAVKYIKLNSEQHRVGDRVNILHGDFSKLNDSLINKFDVVLANPPYIALTEKNNLMYDVVGHEPHGALFSGHDGLEAINAWAAPMGTSLNSGGLLLCEIGYDQADAAEQIFSSTGLFSQINILKDYAGHPRMVYAIRS